VIPLLAIVGPTAVGKSGTALALAKEIGGEIVSADSPKPTQEKRKEIPHHLLDLIEPDEEFSAGRFGEEADKVIPRICERGRVPLLVGGSGLYVVAATEGLFSGPAADKDRRRRWKEEAKESGILCLYEKLRKIDPPAASRIHPHDLVRIIRALEVYEETGRPISSLQCRGNRGKSKDYNLIIIGLNRPRENLYQRIEQRVERMFAQGLVKEVRNLLNQGYGEDLVSMQGLGYKEVSAYLRGEFDENEAMRLLKRNTRRYAKRQLTWFRKDERIQWLDINENETPEEVEVATRIEKILASRGWKG